MQRLIITLTIAISVVVPGGASAQWNVEPKSVTVDEVARWAEAKKMTAVDVNGEKTRATQGVIPGAVLLSSSSQYDSSELPANKNTKLVFYCASQMCSSSHAAARRAIELGYTDVAVLPAGITGWKSAGHATLKPNS